MKSTKMASTFSENIFSLKLDERKIDWYIFGVIEFILY